MNIREDLQEAGNQNTTFQGFFKKINRILNKIKNKYRKKIK